MAAKNELLYLVLQFLKEEGLTGRRLCCENGGIAVPVVYKAQQACSSCAARTCKLWRCQFHSLIVSPGVRSRWLPHPPTAASNSKHLSQHLALSECRCGARAGAEHRALL